MAKKLKLIMFMAFIFAVLILPFSSPVIASTGKLFMVDSSHSLIHELDPSNGAVLNTFPTPESTPEGDGLAYGEGRMFFTAVGGSIYEINPLNGNVVNDFPAPPGAICALGFSCDRLYAMEYLRGPIYVLNPDTGDIIMTLELPVLPYIGGGTFAGTRNSLFITDNGTHPNTIYEINPQNGEVLNSFFAPVLAEDSKGLGFSSSRNTLFIGAPHNNIIYEVNPNNGNIINSFDGPEEAYISSLAADECEAVPPPEVVVGGTVASESRPEVVGPVLGLVTACTLIIWRSISRFRRRATL